MRRIVPSTLLASFMFASHQRVTRGIIHVFLKAQLFNSNPQLLTAELNTSAYPSLRTVKTVPTSFIQSPSVSISKVPPPLTVKLAKLISGTDECGQPGLNVSPSQSVQKYEAAAATNGMIEIGKEQTDLAIHFVADDGDHHIATVDGHNTLHAWENSHHNTRVKSSRVISRISSTTEDLLSVGKINVTFYSPFGALTFQSLNEVNDVTERLKTLSNCLIYQER
ncbi:hypothetical protein MAR_005353 [Mya arenaria]|uniref:Uncharacterized protein n=1 Tax=Mya arenaria TaxID=6604 RepID=A0ABY7F3F4_MYAAR|nr:hypothetical protein MAR_005353 [Mya arenaria]